jgi:integrase
MMSTAVRWEWIGNPPTERARLPRMPTRENRAPDADSVTRLIHAASIEHPEFATFLRLAAATGARRSELLALRWTDIDMERQEVCIARSIAVDDVDGTRFIEKDTKTHQSRTLALDDGSVVVLLDHRARQTSLAGEFGASLSVDGFLFSDQPDASRPWMPDIATHRFRRLCRRNGVEGVRLHDLRHYHGTMLADLGVPMTAVRDRLGHRDLQTTGIYAHGLRATDRVAAELIGNHLDAGNSAKVIPISRSARSRP